MLIIILEFETTLKISKRRCVTILTQHGLLHINKMGKSIKKMQLKKLCRLITVMKECETIEDLNDREKTVYGVSSSSSNSCWNTF